MSMYYILDAMRERLNCFFAARSNFTATGNMGDTFVNVDFTDQFTVEGLREDFKNVIIMDGTTTGRLIPGGREGADANTVNTITKQKIFFDKPLTRDFLLSDNPVVIRAPAGEVVQSVILGDVRVRLSYPAIIIAPRTKTIDFNTFSGTEEKVTIDFIIYVKDDDTQDSTERLLKISDSLEHVLMTNLHIAPTNARYNFEVTSKAHVRSINYGTIEKGSEFVKAANLSWEADMYVWRSYFSRQNLIDQIPISRLPGGGK